MKSSIDKAETFQIIEELSELDSRDQFNKLTQFRSLVSGFQYHHLYKLFLNNVPIGSRVLDWGCGNGHFSYFLIRMKYQVEGFDLETPHFAKRLKEMSKKYSFVQAENSTSITKYFERNAFDAVTSVGVLEHVRENGGDEVTSLLEAHCVLKEGGYLICYHLPNRYSYIEFISKFVPRKHHHKYRYTKNDIKKMCASSKFLISEIKRYSFLPKNSFARWPLFLRKSKLFLFCWETLDYCFGWVFSPLCQNYYFIARKGS